MIAKSKAPHLNREQRRHHKRFAMTLLPSGSGMPWLLMGLMLRGGYMAPGYGIKDLSTGKLVGEKEPLVSLSGARIWPNGKGHAEPKPGLLAKAGRFFRRMIGV